MNVRNKAFCKELLTFFLSFIISLFLCPMTHLIGKSDIKRSHHIRSMFSVTAVTCRTPRSITLVRIKFRTLALRYACFFIPINTFTNLEKQEGWGSGCSDISYQLYYFGFWPLCNHHHEKHAWKESKISLKSPELITLFNLIS